MNIAARLEGLAEPGGVCMSGKVHEEVRGKLPFTATDLGEQALKNIDRPIRVWRVSETRPERAGGGSPVAARGTRAARPTIAVLPFTNMSARDEEDYFSDGITEDLITALAKSRHLSVLARNSTFQYKGRAVDVKAAGRELGADYILEGSVRKGGSRLRVTGQLIDCATGAHLWAERFDRDLADVLAVQDEIVTAITAQLTYDLIDVAAARASSPTTNLTAYDLLLRSRAAWRRGMVMETFDLAKQAVDLDPGFAPTLGFLSFMYSEDIGMQMSGMPVDRLAELSHELAIRALAASDGDAYVHHTVGSAYLNMGDLARSRLHLERALQIDPHFTSTVINFSICILCQGDHQEGLSRIKHALRLEPRLAPAMRAVPFFAHCFLGDCDAAEADLLSIEKPLAFLSLLLAVCLAQAGRHDEAKRYLADFDARKPVWYDVPGFVRWFSKLCGQQVMRERFLDGFRKLGFAV